MVYELFYKKNILIIVQVLKLTTLICDFQAYITY